jgi:hypothetical protein
MRSLASRAGKSENDNVGSAAQQISKRTEMGRADDQRTGAAKARMVKRTMRYTQDQIHSISPDRQRDCMRYVFKHRTSLFLGRAMPSGTSDWPYRTTPT